MRIDRRQQWTIELILTEVVVILTVKAGIGKGCLEIVSVVPLVELLNERFERRTVVPLAGLHHDGDRQLRCRIHHEKHLVPVERSFVFPPARTFNFAIFDLTTRIRPRRDVCSIDDDELTAMFVIGKQLATPRLEAVSEFIGMKFVEGPPERCPIRDVLWLGVIESLSK